MEAQTLHAMLRARAGRMPGKTAVRAFGGGDGLTYAELQRLAADTASVLESECMPGERVVIGFGNSPDFFVVLFACFHAGLTAVPVDANLTADELRAIIDHAEPSMMITDAGTQQKFERLGPPCPLRVYAGDPGTATREPATAVSAGDPALMLYTSGTTGRPKAVRYTHAAILSRLDAIRNWFGFDDSWTSLCLLPTHFGHGLICNCLVTFAYAGTLVIAPPFNLTLLQKLWYVIGKHRVNTFSSVPAVVRLLLEYARHRRTPAGDDTPAPPSLRLVTCASAPLWPGEIRAFEEHFNVPLLNCYGLTETAGWSACSPKRPDRDLESVGMPLDCRMRVIDPAGKALPPGKKGELQIKGPGVMSGYYRHPDDGGVVGEQGWFSTGDVGEIDETGAVFIRSRIKELIIRAGKNICPPEIDGVLMSHPDVVEACAVGLRDPLMGEQVAACVVRTGQSRLSENDLIAYARTSLADYKCPQRILFVDKIPKTGRGKINRANVGTLFEEAGA